MSKFRRQLMMQPLATPLPYDAEVEYLESTGTSGFYIDTGIGRPNTFASAEIQTKVQFTSTSGRQIAGVTNDFYFGVNANRWECNYDVYRGTADTNIHYLAKRMDIANNQNYLNVYLDGSSIWSNNVSYSSSQFGANIGLYNYSANSTIGWQARIFSAKIYINNELVRDFIPVRKNGVGYMYDKISGGLFGNVGTGNFVLGQDIQTHYDAEIEYLQSSGTQYINTGFSPKLCTRLWYSLEVMWEAKSHRQLMGAQSINFFGIDADMKYESYLTMSQIGSTTSFDKVEFGMVSSGSKTYRRFSYINEPLSTTAWESTSQFSSNSICLFGILTTNGQGLESSVACSCRIKSFKIYNDQTGKILMDFIPVRISHVGYMYDKIGNRLYGNAGTGDFILGNDKN